MSSTHRDTSQNHDHAPAAESASIVTSAGGAATVYIGPFTGTLESLVYAPGTIATGADVVCTLETSGEAIWTETNLGTSTIVRRPRVTPHGITGVALAALTVLEAPYLVNDRIKVVIAQGGATKTGGVEALIK